MFKLDLDALREAARHVRLMANPANLANPEAEEEGAGSQLAELATFANGLPQESGTAASASTAEWISDERSTSRLLNGTDRFACTRRRWSDADRCYQAHHWKCPTCIAASQGRGSRCTGGAILWRIYEESEYGDCNS